MHDIKTIAKNCIEDLNVIGIYPNITPNDFKVTNKKRSWGTCHSSYYRSSDTYKHSITIARRLLDDDVDIKAVKNTVYHELLHACDECYQESHGGKWLEYANLVSDCYSMDIKRCTSSEEKGIEPIPKNEYKCKCTHCNAIITQKGYRKPKFYAHYENFYHNCKDGTHGKLIQLPIGC